MLKCAARVSVATGVLLSFACGDGASEPGGDDDDAATSPTPAAICADVDVSITFNPDYPTVPRFQYSRPAGAGQAVLSIEDGPFLQRWSQTADDADAGVISFPLTPGLIGAYTLDLDIGDAHCQVSGKLTNGTYPAAAMPHLTSTASATPGHRDLHLIPATLTGGGGAQQYAVVLIDEAGRLLWRWEMLYPMLTAQLDNQGRGVWTMPQLDTLDGADPPPVTLDLWGWDGRLLESYNVPAGHHDFDFSPDQRQLNSLGYEPYGPLEEACGYTVFGDTLFEYDLDSGDTSVLWRNSTTPFPLPSDCVDVFDGFSYFYANGMERVGNTFGLTFSGGIAAYVIGAADGSWYTLSDRDSDDGLKLLYDGEELRDDLVRAPHSLVCTEGSDWGLGAPDDAITCVGFGRRGFQNCDSADLFWVDRHDQTAHYTATWPPASAISPSTPGCATTASHGNVTLIGEPASAGEGRTRLALYASNNGVLDVLSVRASPSATRISLEYVISPSIPLSVTGAFVTSSASLGAPHEIVSAP